MNLVKLSPYWRIFGDIETKFRIPHLRRRLRPAIPSNYFGSNSITTSEGCESTVVMPTMTEFPGTKKPVVVFKRQTGFPPCSSVAENCRFIRFDSDPAITPVSCRWAFRTRDAVPETLNGADSSGLTLII